MLVELKKIFQRSNYAHVQLIIINLVVFVLLGIFMVVTEVVGFSDVFKKIHDQFQIPASFDVFVRRPWTLLTYAFTHDLTGILHILFNMLNLYWFGRLFVEYLGSNKLVVVYILGAIAGAGFYLLSYNMIPYYKAQLVSHPVVMVGASASINAIVIAVATLLPNYTFYLLFIGAVRIKYIAIFVIFLSFIGTIGANAGGNIAHLGGALMGYVYIKQLQRGVNWGGWITTLVAVIKSLFVPKRKVTINNRKPQSQSFSKKTAIDQEASQEEIDLILDKISEKGYDSLSKEEKEKLFSASKK